MWWVSTTIPPTGLPYQLHKSIAFRWCHNLLPYRISFHPTVKQLIKQSLTPSLPVFPCNSQGGATVPVHPGLQGDVQAFTRGVAEERVGCVRGADPWGGQRRRAAASEGSRVWIQDPALLQWIPGNRQRCQNWQDAGGRCGRVMWMCASSRWCLHVCVCMFRQFDIHSLYVWAHTAAVHSRQRGQDYVIFKCGPVKRAIV